MSLHIRRVVYNSWMKIAYVVIFLNIIFWPNIVDYKEEGFNKFTVTLGGEYVGTASDVESIYRCYREARRELNQSEDGLYIADYKKLEFTGEEVLFSHVDDEKILTENMKNVISEGHTSDFSHSYSVKVNGTILNLASAEEVKAMFQEVIGVYDVNNEFVVSLQSDASRELSVLTTSVNKAEKKPEEEVISLAAGVEDVINIPYEELYEDAVNFDSFDYGIKSMGFSEKIEIVEAYVPSYKLTPLETAKSLLTECQEVQEIYVVQAGDSLSLIENKVGIPMEQIIAMNDSLDNVNSLIVAGQKLIITTPKPAMSVIYTKEERVEEVYDLPTEYTYNEEWYTSDQVTLRQPSAGSHDAVLLVTMANDELINKDLLYEVVISPPVAKLVEMGTIIPPTYLRPISGGTLTSRFGYRNSPTSGASSYHKGVDWGVPQGTSVYASSGGTVQFAGWASGYGYAVYINHPDGRQTRYAHLSKVLVSAGQTVAQGQIIAQSGNTGISTGPHLHFEILINGVQVDPLQYL